MHQLEGQIAIVTGASQGIGRSIAEAYAAEGAKVVLAARKRDELVLVAGKIEAAGGTAVAFPTDVTVEQDVLNLFGEALRAFGRVDILVNSAGISASVATEEMTTDVWRKVLDVNLTGAFLCCREALRTMKGQRSGRVINIGSVSAKVPRQRSAAYTTSKFGLDGLTRSLALDAREYGVAVSIVHPGNTMTPLWDGREQKAHEEGVISPDDVARLVVTVTALPANVNVLESVVFPVGMPLLGRG